MSNLRFGTCEMRCLNCIALTPAVRKPMSDKASVHTWQRSARFLKRSKAALRRSLKWRVTYRIGVDTIPDRFWCTHVKLSGRYILNVAKLIQACASYLSLIGKITSQMYVKVYWSKSHNGSWLKSKRTFSLSQLPLSILQEVTAD